MRPGSGCRERAILSAEISPRRLRRPPCGLGLLLALACAAGCSRAEPPGAERHPSVRTIGSLAAPTEAAASASGTPHGGPLGSLSDNLPFVPDGKTRIGSSAWRTWIYSDTGPRRTRFGYLRAGSIVDARGPAQQNEGCQGGWYRINPRGFVCLGLGATVDLNHPVLVAARRRPARKQSLPYLYALSDGAPPLLYFKLATRAEMIEAEGEQIFARAANFRERIRLQGLDQLIGSVGAPPEFLDGRRKLEKPYGAKQGLSFATHAGRAPTDSGFAIGEVFEWENRLFGLTTELELVGLERTKLVRPSDFHGVELGEKRSLPVGFVVPRYAQRFKKNDRGVLVENGAFSHREGLVLTGETAPGGMVETDEGSWAVEMQLRKIPLRTGFPSFATGDRKWIDISIRHQTLVAYVGRAPVYATLVSTGIGELGDPEKTLATARGSFMIYQKDVSSTMDGEEDSAADSQVLRDVPFVQYFHKGYALHGAYWHDEFGKFRSHGCVNLSPIDAAWLFEWTDPVVPADWHGVINKERGTVVYIHI